MSDLRKAAEMALNYLTNLQPYLGNGLFSKAQLAFIDPHIDEAMEALRQALAQPEWIGLTDEEGAEIWGDAHDIDWKRIVTPKEIIKRIEAKLKEKNGG